MNRRTVDELKFEQTGTVYADPASEAKARDRARRNRWRQFLEDPPEGGWAPEGYGDGQTPYVDGVPLMSWCSAHMLAAGRGAEHDAYGGALVYLSLAATGRLDLTKEHNRSMCAFAAERLARQVYLDYFERAAPTPGDTQQGET